MRVVALSDMEVIGTNIEFAEDLSRYCLSIAMNAEAAITGTVA